MVMALALALPAFAATVKVEGDEKGILNGHTFTAYQVFTGTYENDVLTNVNWGSGIYSTEFLNALKNEALFAGKFADCKSAADVAEVLATYGDSSDEANRVAELAYAKKQGDGIQLTLNEEKALDDGYYLVVDTTETVGEGGAYNKALLQVVENITIAPKTGAPTSEKKVDDKNDSNNTQDEVKWEDSADYDIGDDVPFQLKATIGDGYDQYKTYQLTFHDKESAGLTFDENSVVVKVGDTVLTKDKDYTVKTSGFDKSHDCTFEVHFENLKDIKDAQESALIHAGSTITVEYSSTLNDQAVLGSTGNPNKMHVTYSNNPNDDQGGENGKTPEDTVIVFTYKVVANKVTKNPAYVEDGSEPEYIPLKGAGFTLYKKNASTDEYKEVKTITSTKEKPLTRFEFAGLDDGDYKISETTTPAGYNTIADIEFTITAEHEILSDNPTLKTLNGGNGDKFTGEVNTGVITTDIQNNKGSTLPSTGGIGTTIFYVVGSILVLAAVVLLITKKRMSEDK